MFLKMPAMRSSLLFLFVLSALTSLSEARLVESYVRVEEFPDDTKNVLLREGTTIVNFRFGADGKILDCDVTKRNDVMSKMVELEKERLTGGRNVHYLETEIDVAWYGRYCSRHRRDMRRDGDRKDREVADFLDRWRVREGPIEGTKFCGTGYIRYEWEVSDADRCCQDLARCPSVLSQHHYSFGLFNSFSHRLYDCRCLEHFKDCLSGVDSAEAREVERVFFDVVDLKCSRNEEYHMCEEFSPWFDKCVEGTDEYAKSIVY